MPDISSLPVWAQVAVLVLAGNVSVSALRATLSTKVPHLSTVLDAITGQHRAAVPKRGRPHKVRAAAPVVG